MQNKPLFQSLAVTILLFLTLPAPAQTTSERVDYSQLLSSLPAASTTRQSGNQSQERSRQKTSVPRTLRERALARNQARETALAAQRADAEPCEGFRAVGDLDRSGLSNDVFIDLNNDKRTDLIAVRGDQVSIWLANVTGKLDPPIDVTIEGSVISDYLVLDFNGDGIRDLGIRYSLNGQKGLRIYLHQGNGTYTSTADVSVADHTLDFFEDLNGDNRLDLIAIRPDRLTIRLLNADGTLSAPADYLVGGPNARLYVRRDLNNDGRFDFTVEFRLEGQIRIAIFINNGDGTIQLSQTLNPIITVISDGFRFIGQYETAYSGDFDGDGFRDYFFTNYDNKTSFTGRNLKSYDQSRIFYNNGDGTFTQDTFFAPVQFGFIALEPTIGDINGDQFTDIVAATIGFNQFAINVSTYLGDSSRFLRTRQSNAEFFVGSAPPFATRQPRIFLFSTGIGAELGHDNGVGTFAFIAFSHADGFMRTQRPVLPPRPPTPGPDLNGDTIPDRIQRDFVSPNYVITIEFGNSDGTFRQVFTTATPDFPSYDLFEFNGDGVKDLGWFISSKNTYNILLSKADGAYTGPLAFDLGAGVSSVLELEFNGDNKIDLLVRRSTPDVFSILINDCLGGSGSVNQPPAITAGTALTVQQGSAATTATIATVSDAETAAGTLIVTATTVPAGLTVTSIQNSNGTVTATINATCAATAGSNTVALTVTDGNGAASTASLTVNVTANALPTVGDYPATTLSIGSSATISPTTAPTDDGSISSVTVSASAGFTGTISVNSGDGAITINNARAAGNHSITVTVTDNCGNQAASSLALSVRQPLTTTTLTSSKTSSVFGESVTFTATVNSPDGVPTGSVTFFVDGVQRGAPVTLSGGKATLTLNDLNAGAHTIRADYSGSAVFATSASAVVTQNVDKANAIIKLKTLTTSRLLSVTITVQPVNGSGVPTGAVQVLVNNVLRDRKTLVTGTAQSVITRPDGRATVVVKYNGDDNFNPSQAFIVVQ